MQGVLDVAFWIFLLFLLAWVAIFGGVGALLAASRGSSAAAGLAWGVLLGPLGWLAIWWTTRETDPPPPAEPVAEPSLVASGGALQPGVIDERDLD